MQPDTSRPDETPAPLRCRRWPARRYFVSPRQRLIYCPIPKVACSSLKFWWAEQEAAAIDPPDLHLMRMHRDCTARFTYDRYADELGDEPLDDPRWFRFAFVRNPWSRLVSAFVNKFVQWAHNAQSLVADFRRRLPKRMARQLLAPPAADNLLAPWWLLRSEKSWREQFTFRQFVNHLTACDLARADGHWRLQARFLDAAEFHFIGRFEHLDRDFAELGRLLGRQPTLRRFNATKYVADSPPETCVADWPLSRLRQLPATPPYRCFYTPGLVETVARLYAEDIERFGYEFAESSTRPAAAPLRHAA